MDKSSLHQPRVASLPVKSKERDRTNNVNTAFTRLRTMIPTQPADRKLSKIETLRLACSYITHLHSQISTDGFSGCCLTEVDLEKRTRQLCTFCVTEQRMRERETRPSGKVLFTAASAVQMETLPVHRPMDSASTVYHTVTSCRSSTDTSSVGQLERNGQPAAATTRDTSIGVASTAFHINSAAFNSGLPTFQTTFNYD